MFYLIVFILLLIFACLDQLLNRNFFIYVMGLLLILVAGFRDYTVGRDTIIYYQQYVSQLSGIKLDSGFEVGYNLLQDIFVFLKIPWVGFALFICLLTISIVIKEFKIISIAPAFSLLYYYARFYLYRDINQIRASLAAAIILLSFRFVFKQEPYKFILIILLAESIHSGSIIALVIYPLYLFWKKYKKHPMLIFVLCCAVAAALSFYIGNVISLFHISNNYLTDDYYVYNGRKGLLNPVIWYQFFVSCLALRLNNNGKGIEKEYFDVTLISYLLSTIIIILFSQYYAFAGRLSTLFATTEPVLLMYVCQGYFGNAKFSGYSIRINNLVNRCVFLIPYVIVTVMIFYFIDYSSGQVSTAYSFIW